jgi:hypothetical protein
MKYLDFHLQLGSRYFFYPQNCKFLVQATSNPKKPAAIIFLGYESSGLKLNLNGAAIMGHGPWAMGLCLMCYVARGTWHGILTAAPNVAAHYSAHPAGLQQRISILSTATHGDEYEHE